MERYRHWSKEDDETIARMRAEGVSWPAIGEHFGMSRCAVYERFKKTSKAEPTIEPEERQALHQSSTDARVIELERKLADLATGMNPNRLPVETAAEPPTDAASLWRHCEEDSDRRIEHFRQRTRFAIDFNAVDKGLPIGISATSDQHISPGNIVNFRRMREDAELIAETPGLYAMLGGDGVDNHIVIRPAVLAARSQPAEQWQLYEWWLSIFAPKIVAMISGNHDAWTDQVAGIDMVAEIARRQKLCYAPHEARINATVGGITYKLAQRHRYRYGSSFNMLHAVKQWWRMGEEEFDVGVICHQHEPEVGNFTAHGLERWGARPGAYQVGSSFTKDFGWNDARPTCPTFILYPDKRRIVGFDDIRVAARFLKSERGNA